MKHGIVHYCIYSMNRCSMCKLSGSLSTLSEPIIQERLVSRLRLKSTVALRWSYPFLKEQPGHSVVHFGSASTSGEFELLPFQQGEIHLWGPQSVPVIPIDPLLTFHSSRKPFWCLLFELLFWGIVKETTRKPTKFEFPYFGSPSPSTVDLCAA